MCTRNNLTTTRLFSKRVTFEITAAVGEDMAIFTGFGQE